MLSSRLTPLVLFLLTLAPHVQAQGRAQTTTTTTPTQTQSTPAGRAGRGGVPGPGPAVGGDVDETPAVTHHAIQVNGKNLNYTATAAQMPVIVSMKALTSFRQRRRAVMLVPFRCRVALSATSADAPSHSK